MVIRMREVAEKAMVSVTTVSHVLNKTRHVAPATCGRVLEAVRQLNYYRDAHARRLARGYSDFLGLIVSDIGNPFFPEVIKSFETAALAKGLDLLLCNTNYSPERAEASARKMIENRVRGVAVMTSEWVPLLARELAAHHVAGVFLNLGVPGKYVSKIRVDYSRGIHQAIDHLHGLGHQEIVFIAGPQTLSSAVTRREAFIDALNQWGLPSHRTLEGNHQADGGMAAVRRMITSRSLPTAILCSNDLTAIGALKALAEAGVRVPEEVSVVGFDDIDFASLANPPLTTVMYSRAQLGELAFKALMKMLRSKHRKGAEYLVETELVIRRSTSEAPSSTQPESAACGVAPSVRKSGLAGLENHGTLGAEQDDNRSSAIDGHTRNEYAVAPRGPAAAVSVQPLGGLRGRE
jgi:LacI family transcriptional regulator